MKITNWTFLVGCLAIAGIPGLSGFFSKDEILASAFVKSPVIYAIGLGTALLTAFYMFRLYATTFRGSFRGTHEQEHHLHESPAAITIPLVVLAILSIIGGYVGVPEFMARGAHALNEFLSPVFAASHNIAEAHTVSHSTEWMLTAVSSLLIIITCVFAWNKFSKSPDTAEPTGFGKILANKWYVDELYDKIIVSPLDRLAVFFKNIFERSVVDGIVNGVGRLVNYSSRQLRLLQSGQVGSYVLLMVMAMVLFFVYQFFLRK